MRQRKRRIGPVGTALRLVVGVGLLYLGDWAQGFSWAVEWYDPGLGLVALPALTVLMGIAARRYASGPLRFTGPLGHAVNCAAIVALVANPYTGDAATLFYAATLLVAAWSGQPGCEMTVLSNLILRRDDQVGCPIFSPIDRLDAPPNAPHGTSRGRAPLTAAALAGRDATPRRGDVAEGSRRDRWHATARDQLPDKRRAFDRLGGGRNSARTPIGLAFPRGRSRAYARVPVA